MDLITPNIGLVFWTGLVFLLLLLVLTKFVWKPVLGAVNAREKNITEALELAEKTKAEMKEMHAQNENLLKEARAERDNIVKDARETSNRMIEEAKAHAKTEADKVLASAHQAIQQEKTAAMAELKAHVADLAIEIAEKIVRTELSSDDKQKALASKLAGDINLN